MLLSAATDTHLTEFGIASCRVSWINMRLCPIIRSEGYYRCLLDVNAECVVP